MQYNNVLMDLICGYLQNTQLKKLEDFLTLFLRSNSQIIDTAEGNLSAGQFIGVDIDSENISEFGSSLNQYTASRN